MKNQSSNGKVKKSFLNKRQLREVGLKITGPRTKILQVLTQTNTRHLSAEDIYKILLEAGEDIGLATVYRVLTQFEAAGLVQRQNFEEGYSVFELNQGNHHDHLVCIQCGKVDEFLDTIIEQRQQRVAEKAGYQITDHNLIIYGVCKPCHQKD